MTAKERTTYCLQWAALELIEPTPDEVLAHVPALRRAYNEPTNAVLLDHTQAMSEDDVREHYASLLSGGHAFLLFRDGVLIGDGDLRGVHGECGELAFLILDPALQGQGLGTQLAQLILALAFGPLGMTRIYAALLPGNAASRRVFDKLGFTVDNTVEGLEYGDPGDIVMAIDRETFLRGNAQAVANIRIAVR